MAEINNEQKKLNKKESELFLYKYGQVYKDKVIEENKLLQEKYKDIEIPESLEQGIYKFNNDIVKKKNKQEARLRLYKKIGRSVASLIIVLVITVLGFSIGSEAFRMEIYNLFVEEEDTHFDLSVDFTGDNLRPNDINNFYFPEYVPSDFELKSFSKDDDIQTYYFENTSNGIIFIQINDISNDIELISQIDSEETEYETLNIRGFEGLYTSKNAISNLAWIEEGKLFKISGDISYKESIEIAESIKFYK